MRYHFEWDPKKARQNARAHKVSFEQAATVFLDPNALCVFDQEHSLEEERWVTLGLDARGLLIVLCHTFREVDASTHEIRIISARKATKREKKQYEDQSL